MGRVAPIESLEIDRDGYPDEAVLERIAAIRTDVVEAHRFMREDFPRLCEELAAGYATSRRETVDGVDTLRFSTGGWSGCEDFMNAVLAARGCRAYFVEWRRGGGYTFEIPGALQLDLLASRAEPGT